MCDDLHFVVSSKKIVDPNEQEGESVLLSELHGEIFEPANDLNQREGDYLYMVGMTGFRIILVIIVVNKVYEK